MIKDQLLLSYPTSRSKYEISSWPNDHAGTFKYLYFLSCFAVSCSYSISGYRITLKTEPYQAVAIHNKYRRILANGAYNLYVANMNKLVRFFSLFMKSVS